MAGLAAAVEMQKKLLQEQRAEAAKDKKRFVADPCIAVNDICKSLQCFMQHHKCNDLWRLICPPQSLINVCWQTPVNPEWVVKLSGLAFDIFDFAKNTKLQSVRVKMALQALLEQKNITLPDHLGQKEDAMDSIDLKLRIGWTCTESWRNLQLFEVVSLGFLPVMSKPGSKCAWTRSSWIWTPRQTQRQW